MVSKGIKPMPPMPPPDYSNMAPPAADTASDLIQCSRGSGGADSMPHFFEVSVPPTATPGSQMTVKSPEGKDVAFIVPRGCPPGGVVKLQY